MARFQPRAANQYLANVPPFYDVIDCSIENHGLTAKVKMSKFKMSKYTGKQKDTPIGILSSMVAGFRTITWQHPEFFLLLTRKDKNGPRVNFIISVKFLPTKQFHLFLTSELQTKNFETMEISFKKPLICETNVTYIGNKTFIFSDEIYTSDGVKLANVEMTYGLNDPIHRNLDTLSFHARNKIQFLKINKKPPYINTEIQPNESGRFIHSKRIVSVEQIDMYKHANMASYFCTPILNFHVLNNNKRQMFRNFTILYKKESRLGTELQSISWKDDVTGKYYCKTTAGEKLMNFVEAECYDDHDDAVASKL